MEAKVLFGATDLGASHFSADCLYKTGFFAPDPFFLFEIDGKPIIGTNALEVERATKESRAREVVLLEQFRGEGTAESVHPAIHFLKSRGVDSIVIPSAFPYALGMQFAQHVALQVGGESLYGEERAIKTPVEIAWIEESQRACERAVEKARIFLKECVIEKDALRHGSCADPICADTVRSIIDTCLYQDGFLGIDTIVSCGIQAADPHARGSGLLRPFLPIVIDVFPRSLKTLYFADQTRTFFKGEPSSAYRKMYAAVLHAQEQAIRQIKEGADGKDLFDDVCASFSTMGYATTLSRRPVQGFIHGLGHGVGIEIHEVPNLGSRSNILKEGMVVTVEPGLYYSEGAQAPVGGIRIEDMILVTKDGCRNLTRFPKDLNSVIV